MKEIELKQLWQGSGKKELIQFDLKTLAIELKRKMKEAERRVKARDLRENIAALAGIPIFAYVAYEIPFIVAKIAALLTIGYFLFVIYKLKQAAKAKSNEDFSVSFKDQVAQQKHFAVTQRNLLDSVAYWYALPPFLLNLLLIFGTGDPAIYNWDSVILNFIPDSFNGKLTAIPTLGLMYGFIIWLNKRAVKVYWNPIIKDIQQVEGGLENDDTNLE